MKTIFISLIILFSTSIYAQNNRLKWGPVEKGDRSTGGIEALGWNQGSFYTIQERMNKMIQRKYYLEKLDKNLKLVYSKKLKVKNYGSSYAKIINNQVYLFQIRNKGLSTKEVEFYYNVYDLDGNFIEEVIVANIDGLKKWSQVFDHYWINDSPDGNKIGFAITDVNYKDGYIRLINGVIETSNLSSAKITSKTISVPADINLSRMYHAKITNEGAIVSVLGYTDKIESPFLYNLITLDSEGDYKEPIPLKFDENVYFTNIRLVPNGKNKFLFSGYYLTKEKKKILYRGFFIASLNLTNNKIESFNNFAYTEEFFLSLGYKVRNNGKVKFTGTFDLEIIPRKKSGGGFLIADHSNFNGRYWTTYESIIIPFDSSGEMGKNMVLPKQQSVDQGTKGGAGYFAFCKNDKLYMLYNGSIRNLGVNNLDDLKMEDKPDDKRSATIIATIERGKEIKREKLFTFKEKKGYLVPAKCYKDDNEILISIIDKKKVRYGTMEVD